MEIGYLHKNYMFKLQIAYNPRSPQIQLIGIQLIVSFPTYLIFRYHLPLKGLGHQMDLAFVDDG
jgi:hypothetical protein